MPELPEIETLVQELRPLISGLTFSKIHISNSRIFKTPTPVLKRKLPGKKIRNIFRQGKFLVLELSENSKLWFHLGMTGQLLWTNGDFAQDKHVHAVFKFGNPSQQLVFRDIRKFGQVFMSNGNAREWPEGVRTLGKDPFDLSERAFAEIFRKRSGRIKSLLLNQRLMAGLGNIYADESLFEAKVDPRRAPVRLSREKLGNLYSGIRKVLNLAIRHGGSSIDDYLHADGRRGNFQSYHRVYGREKETCFDCGAQIRRIRLSGRSSFFCPQCQK